MLQVKNIKKVYVTGDLTQTALNDVSVNFRDNEFVAVLGPSGSGKTTLLNIIGGLDRYDSGDLIINGISTKKYKDKHWDSYRNHSIGFVFQSYNLIPHQTILSNVELALTISGISKSERRKRAKEALTKVGLGDQVHKRPNQMSGGQMQRVAIARALVNNPDILLADEPTGALDSDTSVQIMELLKEVATDRLVIMVTHNPELAEEYANRIVRVRDGKIISDTNPFEVDETKLEAPVNKSMGKSSMSWFTSLGLSFNNLRTKKGRTLLTAFAGSIGIIGIALILSLSTGVKSYISDLQKKTMTSYPITIDSESFDISSLITMGGSNASVSVSSTDGTTEEDDTNKNHELDGVYTNPSYFEERISMQDAYKHNNLTAFKKYLDDENAEIHQFIGENGIVYSYDTAFSVYGYDPEGVFVNTDGSTIHSSHSANDELPSFSNSETSKNYNFSELLPGGNGALVSPAIIESYEVLSGDWPKAYNDIVLVVNQKNEIASYTLYELGILPISEFDSISQKIDKNEDVVFEHAKINYEDIINKKFYLVTECDLYTLDESGYYSKFTNGSSEIESIAKNSLELNVCGIIRAKADSDFTPIRTPFGYTKALTDYIIEHTDESAVVKAQLASPERSVINGAAFASSDIKEQLAEAKAYLSSLSTEDKSFIYQNIMATLYSSDQSSEMLLSLSDVDLAAMFDEFISSDDAATGDQILAMYDMYIPTESYEDTLTRLGVVDLNSPVSISLYTDSFEGKDGITDCITKYNDGAKPEDAITYTDYIGILMSSVTEIINVISYILIAFVAVSLIVSSIMIGIITYISVLERTKEIGILRAIGASKHNISQVFNAETFIIGICSGLMGIGATLLILIPSNALIHSFAKSNDVNAFLPLSSAVILVALSTLLTLIGGFIPAKKAAKKDPVAALRSE